MEDDGGRWRTMEDDGGRWRTMEDDEDDEFPPISNTAGNFHRPLTPIGTFSH
jgi:hypothetical protein